MALIKQVSKKYQRFSNFHVYLVDLLYINFINILEKEIKIEIFFSIASCCNFKKCIYKLYNKQ